MNLRVLWMPIVIAAIYHHWCCRYPMLGKIKTKQMKVNWWAAAAVNILHTITVQYYPDVASDGILLIMPWVPQMQKLRPQFLRIQYYQRFLLFCLECLGIWLYFCLLPGIIFYLLISNFLFVSTFFLCHPLMNCEWDILLLVVWWILFSSDVTVYDWPGITHYLSVLLMSILLVMPGVILSCEAGESTVNNYRRGSRTVTRVL